MIDYKPLLATLDAAELDGWRQQLPGQIRAGLDPARYGDLPRWLAALNSLPAIPATEARLNQAVVTLVADDPPTPRVLEQLQQQLMQLHPWRKGPFDLFGLPIDTEWRSDMKWQRLIGHIDSLAGRRVLDVGCGSGYHCWRMRGAGAAQVIGLEPSPLFVVQFHALQTYIQDHRVGVLPIGIEGLPSKLHYFDTVFSMGVLYHRRSPFDHLLELRDALRSDGELILETLVIDGGDQDVLVPHGRYGKMGNVWFIPSARALQTWLEKVGFRDVRLIDVSATTTQEQRSTAWMRFHSLRDFLNPDDTSKTIEGYPGPVRAIVSAKAP